MSRYIQQHKMTASGPSRVVVGRTSPDQLQEVARTRKLDGYEFLGKVPAGGSQTGYDFIALEDRRRVRPQ